MAHWMISLWLCAVPGGTGECVPATHLARYETRAECLREARELLADEPRLHARCNIDRRIKPRWE